MPLSKRVRFEVMKRDHFTCQYCGQKPPAVVLEVDHVVPRASDGGDEIHNLITACFDCNRGKAARELGDVLPHVDLSDEIARLQEREEQIMAYDALKAAERQRYDLFLEYWKEVWEMHYEETPYHRHYVPSESVVSKYIDALGLEDVIQAVDITRAKFGWLSSKPVQYFVGVLRNKAKEL